VGTYDMERHLVWYENLTRINVNVWVAHLARNMVTGFDSLEIDYMVLMHW
jgi:hypothetical protein